MAKSVAKLFVLCILCVFSVGASAQTTKSVVVPMSEEDFFVIPVSVDDEAGEPVYYSRTNLTSPELGSNPGGSAHIRACVIVVGTSAQVRFQSVYTVAPSNIDESDVLLAGTLTNGIGTLTPSANSCSGKSSYQATIINVTPSNLTLNLVGNRTVSTTLSATNACAKFIADNELSCGK